MAPHTLVVLIITCCSIVRASHGWTLNGVVPNLWKRMTTGAGSDTKPKATTTTSTNQFGTTEATLTVAYESFALAPATITEERGGSSMTTPSFHDWLNKKLEESPTHPDCWKKARLAINGTCRAFTHEANQRLALSITTCHLQEAGRKPLTTCPASHDVSRCLQSLDDYRLHLYTEFFNSVKQTCLALQAEIWQAQMDATVQALGQRSLDTIELLGQQSRLQKDLLDNQLVSLENEARLAEEQQGIGSGIREIAEMNSKIRDEMVDLERRVLTASQRLQHLSDKLEEAYAAEESRLSSITSGVDRLVQGWLALGSVWNYVQVVLVLVLLLGMTYPLTGPEVVRPFRPWLLCMWSIGAVLSLLWPQLDGAITIIYTITSGFSHVIVGAVMVCSLSVLTAVSLPHVALFFVRRLRKSLSMQQPGEEIRLHHPHRDEDRHLPAPEIQQQQQQMVQYQQPIQPQYQTPVQQPTPQQYMLNEWSMADLTAAELSNWPRRRLQQFAVRTGACAGNISNQAMINAILQYARKTSRG